MPLDTVEVTSEVYLTITTHALTSETEEIMGLLLGDVRTSKEGQATARIWVAMPQIRTDRRKDRVEASPEQLAQCSSVAEKVSAVGGVRARVIGWYHSHPHITVLPSHVDLRTQASYQMLDEHFVGLIVSVFNEDAASKSQKMEVTAFQSVKAPSPGHLTATRSFSSQAATPRRSDSGHLPPMRSTSGSLPTLPSQPPGSANWDESLAEAIRASKAEARGVSEGRDGAGWVRREVRLDVVQAQGHAERTLTDVPALLKVLFQEEQAAYQQALAAAAAASWDGKASTLVAIHHAAVYQQHLCGLLEHVALPAASMVQGLGRQATSQCAQLRQFKAFLEQQQQQRAQIKAAVPSLMDEDPLPGLIAELQGSLPEPVTQPQAKGVLPGARSPYTSLPASPHHPGASPISGLGSPGAPGLTADGPEWPPISGALSNTPSKRPPSGGHRRTPSGTSSGHLDGLAGIGATATPTSPQRLAGRSPGSAAQASSPSWQTDPYAYGVIGASTAAVGSHTRPQGNTGTPQLLPSPFRQYTQAGPSLGSEGDGAQGSTGPHADQAATPSGTAAAAAHPTSSQIAVAASNAQQKASAVDVAIGRETGNSPKFGAHSKASSGSQEMPQFGGTRQEPFVDLDLRPAAQPAASARSETSTRLQDQVPQRQSFETDRTAFSVASSSAGDLQLSRSSLDAQWMGPAAAPQLQTEGAADLSSSHEQQQSMTGLQEPDKHHLGSLPKRTLPDAPHTASLDHVAVRAENGQAPGQAQSAAAGQVHEAARQVGSALDAQGASPPHGHAPLLTPSTTGKVRNGPASDPFQYLSSTSEHAKSAAQPDNSLLPVEDLQHQQQIQTAAHVPPDNEQPVDLDLMGASRAAGHSKAAARGRSAQQRWGDGISEPSSVSGQSSREPGQDPATNPPAQMGGHALHDAASNVDSNQDPTDPFTYLMSPSQAGAQPSAGAASTAESHHTPTTSPAAAVPLHALRDSSSAGTADSKAMWPASAAVGLPGTGHSSNWPPAAVSTHPSLLDTQSGYGQVGSHTRQSAPGAAGSSLHTAQQSQVTLPTPAGATLASAAGSPSAVGTHSGPAVSSGSAVGPRSGPAAPSGAAASSASAPTEGSSMLQQQNSQTRGLTPTQLRAHAAPAANSSPSPEGRSAFGVDSQVGMLPVAQQAAQQTGAASTAKGAWQAGRPSTATTGASQAGAGMSEAERQFWAEAGMQPEDLRDAVAERPASAGGSSGSAGPLTAAEQQAFWAEAGVTPEELGIAKAGSMQERPEAQAQAPHQGELAGHNLLNLAGLRRAFKGRKNSKSKLTDRAKPSSSNDP
ncbi:hypothetical protein WJX74_009827 [Apatococcus lobatus]|uniref:MPN domain-containing protein n=1 Tax=Apatococcus lobatus TaxID=904363 RepID=A0AAW1RX75_9CHLO